MTSSGRIVEVAESDLEGGDELETELEAVLASVASLDDRLLEQRGDGDAVTVFDANSSVDDREIAAVAPLGEGEPVIESDLETDRDVLPLRSAVGECVGRDRVIEAVGDGMVNVIEVVTHCVELVEGEVTLGDRLVLRLPRDRVADVVIVMLTTLGVISGENDDELDARTFDSDAVVERAVRENEAESLQTSVVEFVPR